MGEKGGEATGKQIHMLAPPSQGPWALTVHQVIDIHTWQAEIHEAKTHSVSKVSARMWEGSEKTRSWESHCFSKVSKWFFLQCPSFWALPFTLGLFISFFVCAYDLETWLELTVRDELAQGMYALVSGKEI